MQKSYFLILIVMMNFAFGQANAEQVAKQHDDLVLPVENAINLYILPNFERFSQEIELLDGAIETLCKKPSQEELEAVQKAFKQALLAYGRIEFIRLGALSENNNSEKMLFWPDRQGIALKQVQKILHKKDESVLDATRLAQKSVALQGFGTLEYILFGKGFEALTTAKEPFRCGFAKTLTQSMAQRAQEISQSWQQDEGHVKLWRNPNSENPQYRNSIEALNALVGTLAHGLENIRDLRLKPILGLGKKGKKGLNPKRALLWRSDMSFHLTKANLQGFLDLWRLSKLDALLNEDNKWLSGSIQFEFTNAINALAEIETNVLDIKNNVAKIGQLKYLMIVTRSLQDLIAEQYAAQVGLPSTFSSLDGD